MTITGELIGLNDPDAGAVLVTRASADGNRAMLPPILEGCYTLSVEEKTRLFVRNVPDMLERWISRRTSPHTRRAYRQDLFTFIYFLHLRWPDEAAALFAVTVGQVHAYRDALAARGDAPKTINRRRQKRQKRGRSSLRQIV